MHYALLIKLKDIEIPIFDEYKFLGAIFDRKLTFIPHMKYLKTNPPQPNNYYEWSPTQNGERTDKRNPYH